MIYGGTALSCSVSLWHKEINGNTGAHVGYKCKHRCPAAALMCTKAAFTDIYGFRCVESGQVGAVPAQPEHRNPK